MYEFFYDLAVYANENWKGNFTPKEIAVNAYLYTCDCQCSTFEEPVGSMFTLLRNLGEDYNNGSEEEDYYLTQLIEYLNGKE